MADLDKLPAVFAHLERPRPFAAPRAIAFEPLTNTLTLDTGFDELTLNVCHGDPQWLIDAHKLGGLLVRIAPTQHPHRLSVFASWEDQTIALIGEVA